MGDGLGDASMPSDSDSLVDRYLAISRAIAGQMDYQNVLRQVAKEVDSLFQPDHMDIAIILPDQRACLVSFEVGMRTGWSKIKDPAPLAGSPIRSLLMGEVPDILTGDAWEDERFHFNGAFDKPIFDAKLHSRMHVPLHVHGGVLGSLNISSHQKNKYTEADMVIAQQVARPAGALYLRHHPQRPGQTGGVGRMRGPRARGSPAARRAAPDRGHGEGPPPAGHGSARPDPGRPDPPFPSSWPASAASSRPCART